jgi:DNA-binding response OmpR family regulator
VARILVIDDDEQIRAMLRRVLEGSGYEVSEACHGLEGLQRYRATPADIVITDIAMPEKDGLETILELRRASPDVQIIAISGGSWGGFVDYLDLARRFGAQWTLPKPLDPTELLETVHGLLKPSLR